MGRPGLHGPRWAPVPTGLTRMKEPVSRRRTAAVLSARPRGEANGGQVWLAPRANGYGPGLARGAVSYAVRSNDTTPSGLKMPVA